MTCFFASRFSSGVDCGRGEKFFLWIETRSVAPEMAKASRYPESAFPVKYYITRATENTSVVCGVTLEVTSKKKKDLRVVTLCLV